MRYNFSPILDSFHNAPSFEIWEERIPEFFNNDNYDAAIRDEYYNILISNSYAIKQTFIHGYLIDEYSGLFTFNTPETRTLHSFNLANFVRRNYAHFANRKIHTITADYGILNIQTKLCGLSLTGVTVKPKNKVGCVLVAIGNKAPPYSFKAEEADVYIASNVFMETEEAYNNWSALYEQSRNGKEVYISSCSFHELDYIVDYDIMKMVENPAKVYDPDVYSNADYGYMTKIYKLV